MSEKFEDVYVVSELLARDLSSARTISEWLCISDDVAKDLAGIPIEKFGSDHPLISSVCSKCEDPDLAMEILFTFRARSSRSFSTALTRNYIVKVSEFEGKLVQGKN